ncbi:uncharacterized protein [Pocillopora verrucosa]|uniref:uncharacterized protein n=1 Tax=Pocillopora verrucosa TaxID=203993 RepID=UPI00333E9061
MSFELEKIPDNDGQSSSSSNETDEDDATLPEPSESFVVNQITKKFEELRQRREDLHKAFVEWIPKRKNTREQLQELATKLHEHHRNVNISTVTGASLGTVGGVLSIAGLIAAPFTFGAGLVVSLVGAGIGGTGGLVMSGSKVVEIILTKLGLKEVQEAIDVDREACAQLQEKLEALENFIYDLAEFLKPLHDDAQLKRELEGSGFTFLQNLASSEFATSPEEKVEFGARFFRVFSSAASVSASAFATAGTLARSAALAGTRVAHVAGSIVSAALLPLDITLLVKSSLELQRGSTSKAVEDIRQILSELECPEEEEIQLMVESFIDEKFTEAYNDDIDKGEDDKGKDDKSKGEDATEKPNNGGANNEILLPEEVYVQVITRFRELDRLGEELVNTFKQWIPKRKRTMEKLEELASKLHQQHINVSKSTIAGASASTVGGILAIAGLIATPFTFGAGLVVSLIGAGIGGTGSLVMSVSKVIEIILAKLGLKDVQRAIDEDKEACTQLQEKLENLERFISDLREIESNGFEFLHNLAGRVYTTSTEEKIDFFARFLRVFSSTASVGAGAFAAAGAFARAGGLAGANLAGGVAGAVLLPLDIYMLVKSSLEVHRGSTTQVVNDLRKLLSELKCPEEDEIQEMVRKFICEKLSEAFNDGVSNEVQRDNGDDLREAETVAI